VNDKRLQAVQSDATLLGAMLFPGPVLKQAGLILVTTSLERSKD